MSVARLARAKKAESVAALDRVLLLLRGLQQGLWKFLPVPEGGPKYFLPPSAIRAVEALAHLASLSDLERAFVESCASDALPGVWDARLAYADWLEERGDEVAGARVRKLTPEAGDVLAHYVPPSTSTQEALELHVAPARALAEALAARGVVTTFAVIPPGGSIARLPEEQMAAAGWVRAARVAEEREACARLAERPYGDGVAAFAGEEPLAVGAKIAAAIRARGEVPA